jgi:ParB family transcriptional regulator, chromosome partitioning protein
VSKSGLPGNIKTRHDLHYIEELSRPNKTIGKVIQIDLVEPNPEQPRTEFGDLTDLTNSIKEHGVLEPLLVRPIKDTNRWMIIAGERRWRSANLAGLKEVPCIELDITDESVAEIALVENLQRKDLTIWEEADGIAQLGARYGYTHEKISQVIGKGRTTITEYMAIAGIPAPVRDKCIKGEISAKSALLEIARQFDDEAMHAFVDSLLKGGTKSRDAAREKSKATKGPKVSARQEKASQVSDESTEDSPQISGKARYHYKSKDGSFDIEIRFDRDGKPGRSEVLEALKEAFDKVKKGL